MKSSQCGGSPIGRERFGRVNAPTFARLRVLGFHREKMGHERSMPVIGMPLT